MPVGKVTREVRTPHLVLVTRDGKTASRKVTVDRSRMVEVRP